MQTKQPNLSEQEQNAIIYKDIAQNGSFAEYCIAIDKNYELEWFHKIIARKLQNGFKRLQNGENVRLMFTMPPRHGKSDEITQKFPSWALGKDPTIPIMVSSYSDDLATDFGQLTRDIMQTEEYKAMFNTQLRSDAKAKGKWLTQDKGGYTAVGVGGALTGRGFKIGIIDDPFKNREEADSATIRESRHKWYKSTFYTRQEGNSMIIFIMTRWHEDDLAGRVLRDAEEAKKAGELYDEWEIINFPAIATEDDEYRKEGESLWPSKFNIDKLKTIKSTIGGYEFSALYQQNPIDEENRKFKDEWYKYRELSAVRDLDTYNVMTIDPRGKDDIKLGKDFIGVTVNFVDREGKWNIITTRAKLSSTDLIDLMFTNWNRYNLHKIGIEDNQFTQGLLVAINNEMELRNVYMDIVLLKHGGTQKELRIEALVPRYEHGGIFHIKVLGENICSDLEEELRLFPKSANDDASDSLAYQTYLLKNFSRTPAGIVTSTPYGQQKTNPFEIDETGQAHGMYDIGGVVKRNAEWENE